MDERKWSVLFEHRGENSDTAKDPVALWSGQVDLSAKKTVCRNWDDNGLLKVQRYEVREVSLPIWFGFDDWLRNRVYWKFAWGMGVERDWPENWQRRLMGMSSEQQLAAVKLLKTETFRSLFRVSLRNQLVKWLDAEERPYPSPFTARQWACLVNRHLALAARNRSEALYRSARHG